MRTTNQHSQAVTGAFADGFALIRVGLDAALPCILALGQVIVPLPSPPYPGRIVTYGLIFGIFLFLAGIGAGWIVPRYPESWRVLPRERYAGLVIGIICVVWSLSMVSLLLEGSLAAYRPYLMYLGIGLVIGSFFYLEYLFTRALGGFILLMSNEVMHQAFVQHVPQRWFISICCYLLGLIGIFLITSPFRFRDLLKRLPTSSAWRYGTALPLMIAGAATCILFLLARSA